MRDRTNLFLSYRQSYTHHPHNAAAAFSRPRQRDENGALEERQGLMSDIAYSNSQSSDTVIEMGVLSPQWEKIQMAVDELLKSIAVQMVSLEQLHRKHLLLGFEDESVKEREKAEIDHRTSSINTKFKQARSLVQGIEQSVSSLVATGNISETEAKLASNLKVALASKIGVASVEMRKKQSAYLERLRQYCDNTPYSGRGQSGPGGATIGELDRNVSSRSPFQRGQLQQTTTFISEPEYVNDTIRSRQLEMDSVSNAIREMTEMSTHMTEMVADQGAVIDRIDQNVMEAHENVVQASVHVTAIRSYARRGFRCNNVLVIVVAILTIVVLITVFTGRPSARVVSAPPIHAPTPGLDPWAGFERPPPTAGS